MAVSGNSQNLCLPLNFGSPHLVHDAWREEESARAPVKLKKLDDIRKVNIFKDVVGKVKDAVSKGKTMATLEI